MIQVARAVFQAWVAGLRTVPCARSQAAAGATELGGMGGAAPHAAGRGGVRGAAGRGSALQAMRVDERTSVQQIADCNDCNLCHLLQRGEVVSQTDACFRDFLQSKSCKGFHTHSTKDFSLDYTLHIVHYPSLYSFLNCLCSCHLLLCKHHSITPHTRTAGGLSFGSLWRAIRSWALC